MCCASAAALSISCGSCSSAVSQPFTYVAPRLPSWPTPTPRAGQHRRYFGAEFFAGVLHATEIPGAVLERVAVQPIGVAGGMPEFVEHGLVVPVRGCELVTFGKGDAVGL